MKRNKLLTLAAALLFCAPLAAQDGINGTYDEPANPEKADAAAWNALESGLYASWASRDVLYKKHEVPGIKLKQDTVVYAWRGERVGMEALLFAKENQGTLALRVTAEGIDCEARFVNYALTDNFRGCGNHPTDRPPFLVPDVIDIDAPKVLNAQEVRPVWCTIEVPRDAEAGTHSVKVEVVDADGNSIETLGLRVEVRDRTLPEPKDIAFNLNFWQQPYAASRYYNVEPWSRAHFDALRPYMTMLARAGQKSATAILFYEPWGVQSNDKFEPMVETIKKTDGTWTYDYTVFDSWIEFLDSCGINEQINCFSMVPWDMSFRYMDEATGKYATINAQTGDAAFRTLWTDFLTAFAAHLREKGWLEKTVIAMDERGLGAMNDAYNIAQAAVPGIKMALAGNYHTELVDKMFDYCIAWGQEFKPEELSRRNERGWVTTCYTACPDGEPNICSNNNPSDAAYLPLHAISKGFNGFLRWAWMNWTDDPLRDTRFRMFTPGDTYVVYPGGRSGIRFERIIEGILAAEKVRILREEYAASGNTEALNKLNTALDAFKSGTLNEQNSSAWLVNYMESILNDSPEPPAEKVTDYCSVYLSADKSNIAIEKRWLTSATTTGCETNLNYSATSKSEQGYVITPNAIRVKPGTTFKFRVKATQNDDDLRWCRAAVFADWNCDSIFHEASGELVARKGDAETSNVGLLNCTFNVTVPADATPGMSRLRLVYADAWKPVPQACGELYKGFAFDVPMQIIEAVPSGITGAATVNSGSWRGDTLTLAHPAAIFVYDFSGALIDHATSTQVYGMKDYLPGNYILLAIDANGRQTTFRHQVR